MDVVEGWAEIEDAEAFVDRLTAAAGPHGATVQAFDARAVAGREHLAAAVDRANRAFDRDDAIARDRAVEILLYAAGRRQIEQALELGVDPGRTPVAIVVDGGDEAAAAAAVRSCIEPAPVLGTERDDARIVSFFGITPAERDATDGTLEDLVIERVALLAVDR